MTVGGPWAGAAWHPCSCGPEGLARRRKGETHQEGSLGRGVLTWDSSTPWLWCPPGGGTFQTERSKFGPGMWTADFFFCPDAPSGQSRTENSSAARVATSWRKDGLGSYCALLYRWEK